MVGVGNALEPLLKIVKQLLPITTLGKATISMTVSKCAPEDEIQMELNTSPSQFDSFTW